jgi:putative addiction module killer protein
MFLIKRTDEFNDWLSGIRDGMTQRRLVKRLRKVTRQPGGCHTRGDGVFEMREHFGPGWRVYYIQRGSVLIVMLGGGDKSTQTADIAKAVKLAAMIEE